MDAVFAALTAMRPPFAIYEYDIHRMVEDRLAEADMAYVHEAKIGPGCRIDYLVGRVGVEIKKGKPMVPVLLRQLMRYAACPDIDSMIVVTQQSAKLPGSIGGKPLRHIVLSQLWGVALP